jgi:hypothetical protein
MAAHDNDLVGGAALKKVLELQKEREPTLASEQAVRDIVRNYNYGEQQ